MKDIVRRCIEEQQWKLLEKYIILLNRIETEVRIKDSHYSHCFHRNCNCYELFLQKIVDRFTEFQKQFEKEFNEVLDSM
jgi:hypothetical protein